MEIPPQTSTTPPLNRPPPRQRQQRRPPGPNREGGPEVDQTDASAESSRRPPNSHRRNRQRPHRDVDQDGIGGQSSDHQTEGNGANSRGPSRRGRGQPSLRQQHSRPSRPSHVPEADHAASSEASTHMTGGETPSGPRPGPRSRRAAKFNPNLTTEAQPPTSREVTTEEKKPSERYRRALPKGDDLTSTLIRTLSSAPYPDCLICFAPIHPAQPTWSCSPLIPTAVASDDEKEARDGGSRLADTAQCCWTTFHLKCIRSWASKSVKDVADAWRARGEERQGNWRCPGCQSKRVTVPNIYWYVFSFLVRISSPDQTAGVSVDQLLIPNVHTSPHLTHVLAPALVLELVVMRAPYRVTPVLVPRVRSWYNYHAIAEGKSCHSNALTWPHRAQGTRT